MSLLPIKNTIIFKFVDKVNAKGQFEKERTESGIILQSSFDDSAKDPRWVNIVAVGPDCTLKPGQQALLPNLRWTQGFKHEGEMMWKTDESQVAAFRDGPDTTLQAMTNHVIFVHRKQKQVQSYAGLTVVGGHVDTPSGVAIALGPDCQEDLKGATFYYDNTNFTDNFQHGGFSLAFIKDDNILAYEPKSGE